MAEPRNTREALIAQLLGDLDTLYARAEQLPQAIAQSEAKLKDTVTAIDAAGDKYRLAVTAFTEQARTELTEYLQRKAGDIASKTIEEQRAALQEAARAAFRSEASDKAAQLGVSLSQAAREFRRSRGSRLLEHGITALLSSMLTAGLVLYIVRHA